MDVCWIELTESDQGVLARAPQPLQVPEGASIVQALELMGLTAGQIQTRLKERSVAVFGQYALAATVLHPGDRIELLDALHFDPMHSRRRREAHKLQADLANGMKPKRRSQKRFKF